MALCLPGGTKNFLWLCGDQLGPGVCYDRNTVPGTDPLPKGIFGHVQPGLMCCMIRVLVSATLGFLVPLPLGPLLVTAGLSAFSSEARCPAGWWHPGLRDRESHRSQCPDPCPYFSKTLRFWSHPYG